MPMDTVLRHLSDNIEGEGDPLRVPFAVLKNVHRKFSGRKWGIRAPGKSVTRAKCLKSHVTETGSRNKSQNHDQNIFPDFPFPLRKKTMKNFRFVF
jgi:hypothetical protein